MRRQGRNRRTGLRVSRGVLCDSSNSVVICYRSPASWGTVARKYLTEFGEFRYGRIGSAMGSDVEGGDPRVADLQATLTIAAE